MFATLRARRTTQHHWKLRKTPSVVYQPVSLLEYCVSVRSGQCTRQLLLLLLLRPLPRLLLRLLLVGSGAGKSLPSKILATHTHNDDFCNRNKWTKDPSDPSLAITTSADPRQCHWRITFVIATMLYLIAVGLYNTAKGLCYTVQGCIILQRCIILLQCCINLLQGCIILVQGSIILL